MYPYSSATIVDRDGFDEAFIGIYYSTWDLNDENNTRSYAIVIGSTEFLSQSYASTCMKQNHNDVLLSQIYDEMISFEGINFIQFTNNKALEVTGNAATAWTVTTIVVVPVIAAVLGTVVWIRRRHS
jgi:dolichyl-phosphate-mannose--protein O-mannosyl transferase